MRRSRPHTVEPLARTSRTLAWAVLGLALMGGAGCGADEPDPMGVTCSLSEIKQYGAPPYLMVGSYAWRAGDLKQIQMTWMNATPGHGPVKNLYYDYDYLDRLEVEIYDADLQVDSGLYYNIHKVIEYDHERSSAFKQFTPSSARYYTSLLSFEPVLEETAFFGYSEGVLQSAAYYDSQGDRVRSEVYEHVDGCVTKVVSTTPDGARIVTEHEYDDQRSPGVRAFGDHYYVASSSFGDGRCGHNLVKTSSQRTDVLGISHPQTTQTYSYTYREDGLPARVEYTLSEIPLGMDFFYDCRLEIGSTAIPPPASDTTEAP